jgi:hypothetical protein
MKAEFSLRDARCWEGIIGDYYVETEKYSLKRETIQDVGFYLGDRRDKTPCPHIDQQVLAPNDGIAPLFANS